MTYLFDTDRGQDLGGALIVHKNRDHQGLSCTGAKGENVIVTNWSELHDCYGSAEQIPALLAQASNTPDASAPIWDELWGRLCHQGTAYEASYAALPILARMAAAMPLTIGQPALSLAAGILLSGSQPELEADARRRYASELAALRDVNERLLALDQNATDFLYTLWALAALDGHWAWAAQMDSLVCDEIEGVECPVCKDTFDLVREGDLGERVAFKDAIRGLAVTPASEADLDGVCARLYALASEHGQAGVAAGLLALGGTVTCPLCGAAFAVAHAW